MGYTPLSNAIPLVHRVIDPHRARDSTWCMTTPSRTGAALSTLRVSSTTLDSPLVWWRLGCLLMMGGLHSGLGCMPFACPKPKEVTHTVATTVASVVRQWCPLTTQVISGHHLHTCTSVHTDGVRTDHHLPRGDRCAPPKCMQCRQ